MKAWPLKLRQGVISGRREGRSPVELAAEFEVPLGTVKAWCSRAQIADMQPPMQPLPAKGKHADMQQPMQPGLARFRGVTAVDLPGKTRADQSMNFMMLKRGQYPPRSAGIPGTLEGAALLEALRAWCARKGKRRAGEVLR